MRRGEVWWAKLPAPLGRRPVVLASRDLAYAVRTRITVAEVTTRGRGIETEVPLTTRDGLPRACFVNADNIHTIDKAWLEERITRLSPEKVRRLNVALKLALGLD